VGECQDEMKVWISYRDRWYPGILDTWNTRDGVFRGWVTYSVPVNGWPGGWYDMSAIRTDDGSAGNDDGRTWDDLTK
jgi:hypothetical protein